MKKNAGYMSEWQEAYMQYLALQPVGKRQLDPLINKIHAVACKEADTTERLLDLYFHNLGSVLKEALGGLVASKEMLWSDEVAFIARVAFYKRYKELRPEEREPSIMFKRK